MPKITVGLPVYNAEMYLNYAILSIINQTEKDWQLIIIDDGSNDNSMEIAKRYSDDPRITIISDGKNLGLSLRLNQISQLATGTYVARMDADDIMHPERLERQSHFLDANSNIEIVCSYAFSIDKNNRIHGIRKYALPESDTEIFTVNKIVHPTVMMRRSWSLINPYNHRFDRAEDYELWTRVLPDRKFGLIPEALLFYRELGVSSPSKYYRTSKTINRIITQYGTRNLRPMEAYKYIVRNNLKTAAFFLAYYTNNSDIWVRNRYDSLTASELLTAYENLKQATKGS